MITLETWDHAPSPWGRECSIYGRPGKFELWVDDPSSENPSAEGPDAAELEGAALVRGASHVFHWYHGGRDHETPCDCGGGSR